MRHMTLTAYAESIGLPAPAWAPSAPTSPVDADTSPDDRAWRLASRAEGAALAAMRRRWTADALATEEGAAVRHPASSVARIDAAGRRP